MTNLDQFSADLQAHAALCEELLLLAQSESHELASLKPESFQRRRELLPRLDDSLARLREHRLIWQRLDPGIRQQNSSIHASLQRTQQMIMRIVALDRDNEQAKLRRGLGPLNASSVPSSSSSSSFSCSNSADRSADYEDEDEGRGRGDRATSPMPQPISAHRERPHFVAELYRRYTKP